MGVIRMVYIGWSWQGLHSVKRILKMQYSWSVLIIVVCLAVATSGCYLPGKQDEVNQVHVIHLGASDEGNSEDSEPEVIEIHLPADVRRKREIDSSEEEKSCKTDAECPEGFYCDQLLICHPPNSPENEQPGPKHDTIETENHHEESSHPTHSVISINISTTYEP